MPRLSLLPEIPMPSRQPRAAPAASRVAPAAGAMAAGAALAVALLLSGCDRGGRVEPAASAAPASPEAGVTVATVDGVTITRGELAQRARRVSGGDAAVAADPALLVSLLDQLVEERILLAEAERRGLSLPPAEVEAAAKAAEAAMGPGALERELSVEGITLATWQARIGETLLIRALLATIPPPTPITEHDVRSYYEAHRADFRRPEQFRARIITVPTRREAEALGAQLAGGADFAALARAKSTSPEKEAGGDLGFLPKERLPPEFDAALERLKPGELSPVIESPYGFHIFRLEERRKAQQPKLEEIRDEIRETLAQDRLEAAHERWLADLRKKAKVEILDPELRSAR